MLAASGSSSAQGPTVADLVDNNLAFIKLDRANTNLGASFQMHFIDTVTVNGVIKAYYIKNIAGHLGIALAESTDGINFTHKADVVMAGAAGTPDSNMASFPGVWYENGTYYVVYEAVGHASSQRGAIGLATSTDGITFTKQGIILDYAPNTWEAANIGTPSLYKENGIWYLFYHGSDYNVCQIGVATGTSLLNLTKHAGNPILAVAPGKADAGTLGRRGVKKVGSKYYMVYEVSENQVPGAPGFQGARWSSAMASSSDLLNWTKFSQNPILPQTVFADGFGNDGPTFLSTGGLNYVYYRISATSPVTRRALIANQNYGGFDTSWTMSGTFIGHDVGRPDGDGWSANMTQDPNPGFLQYGPYYPSLPAGDHIATWSLMIDNNSSNDDEQMRLEVVDVDNNYAVVQQRIITRKQWKQPQRYEYFSVPFRVEPSMLNHRLEFRAYWYRRAFIREGKVGLS